MLSNRTWFQVRRFFAENRKSQLICRIVFTVLRKEGLRMKRDGQSVSVRCLFTKEGENPQELIFRSLRFFIEKNLRNAVFF